MKKTSTTKRRKKVADSRKKPKAKIPRIHRWMNVLELAELHPRAGDILAAYGLHCIGCAYSEVETLEEGALAHGLTDDDISNILIDLEELLTDDAQKPQTITITEPAARALVTIAQNEGKEEWKLRVTTDETGSFCMEFVESTNEDDAFFGHPSVPNLTLVASKDALGRIGGSVIDHREGRFKLDLAKNKACACGESCTKCESA
jgi:hybrid cluster-associated redox disulfide protein